MRKILALSLLLVTGTSFAGPQIVAHRGGTADAPENTVQAIKLALENQAQAVWITVQLSKDGVPVLYRPSDLKALTNKTGKISDYTLAELSAVDAGWSWGGETHPWRGKGVTIPTLKSVLETWPQTRFYIDIKSPDADPATMGKALLAVLNETQSLGRVRVYSTEDRYLASLPAAIPRFVTRSETRSRLVTVSLSHQCLPPEQTMQEYWYALELNRTVDVVEKFTLGEGGSRSTLTWDKESMDCFRSQGNSHVILLGVNTAEDYKKAEALQADAVMVDSPAAAKAWAK
ncbi:glycerophosphodiester phosphodiesterase [Enterobacter cloacae]|uniref:glycerophosphodiester phosphodiesterase family protein n=1 Tax=Enterobacter cloacae TaxID=550 RepID=UPI001E4F6170|nr:glycerophosphodiester phosphodiesterase family protein [Enterobacter cloacae]MCD1391075.1 glycerophosphodiester phosphodiesterase [Enterobacter cloacae]